MTTVYVKDHGILPDTDITLPLCALFRKYPYDTTFVFENADYYLTPHEVMHYDYRISNSDVTPYRVLGLWLKEMENCVLQGSGARLYFAGQMQAVTMDHCKNITMENFVIDWKKPLIAEGTVVAFGDCYVDLYIDPTLYPHRFVNGWIEFDTGNDEWYPQHTWAMVQFDGNTKCVSRTTGDNFSPKSMEDLGGNVYRYHSWGPVPTNLGNIFVLRHNDRIHPAMFTEKCEDITFSDITVYCAGGVGCLGQFCHNLTYRRIHFGPHTAIGRKVAGLRDDGMHVTSNSGTITVTECTYLGLMDDPINLHGCFCTVDQAGDEKTLHCRYHHPSSCGFLYWAEPGDEIAVVERRHMTQIATAQVASYVLDENRMQFTLTFNEPLPQDVLALASDSEGLAIENLTHTAGLVCTNNRFGSCRARSILVSTPRPVRIVGNYFTSAGSAILMAGDANYWFESGACHDVEITDNVFTDVCLSSMYQYSGGMISIWPEVPEPDVHKPFHTNIRITGNTFDTPDTPILHAYSCGNLTFTGNRIFHSPCAEKWHPADWRIKLDHCCNAVIGDNLWVGNFGLAQFCVMDTCENVSLSEN